MRNTNVNSNFIVMKVSLQCFYFSKAKVANISTSYNSYTKKYWYEDI